MKNTLTTYAKLTSGAWGLRSKNEALSTGDMVDVTKRDGTVKTECVGRIIRVDAHGALAEIASKPAAQASSSAPRAPRYYAAKCPTKCRMRGCSQKAVDRGYCRACAFDEFDD